jgi:hypothetical protein
MEQTKREKMDMETAKRETEEIAEAVKMLPSKQKAMLQGFIMGMQAADVEKAG